MSTVQLSASDGSNSDDPRRIARLQQALDMIEARTTHTRPLVALHDHEGILTAAYSDKAPRELKRVVTAVWTELDSDNVNHVRSYLRPTEAFVAAVKAWRTGKENALVTLRLLPLYRLTGDYVYHNVAIKTDRLLHEALAIAALIGFEGEVTTVAWHE
jgi:hypothetical protein